MNFITNGNLSLVFLVLKNSIFNLTMLALSLGARSIHVYENKMRIWYTHL